MNLSNKHWKQIVLCAERGDPLKDVTDEEELFAFSRKWLNERDQALKELSFVKERLSVIISCSPPLKQIDTTINEPSPDNH